MTLEEAKRLLDGGGLGMTIISGVIASVELLGIVTNERPEASLVIIRRCGKTAAGHRFPASQRRLRQLRTSDTEPVRANVYADWLEENGEPEAAKKLRAAFPFTP